MAPPRVTDVGAPHGNAGALLRGLGTAYIFATPLDFVPSPVGTPATVAGLLFLTQWLIALGAGPRLRFPKSLAVPLIGVLAIWSAISSIWSINPEGSLSQGLTVALLGLSAVAIASTFRDDFRLPAWAIMLGSGVAGMAALVSGPESAGPYGVIVEQATFLGIDQNALAFHLCLGLAASYYLILSEPRLIRRTICIGFALLLAAAILAVGSRTGGGTLVISSLLFVVLSTKSVRTALAGGTAILTLAWVYVSMAQSGVMAERLVGWYRAPVLMDDRALIISQFWELRNEWIVKGVGAGADADYLYATLNWYRNAHSAFWKTWIELGIIGLVVWFAILFNLIYQVVRTTDRLLFVLAAPAIAAFFYTLGPVNSNLLWALFGLALGATRTHAQAQAQRNQA